MKNPPISDFAEKNQLEIKNLELFETAFTHRSFINELTDKEIQHNERLEFLGDAVLELIISELLFIKYPNCNEGELTSFRSAIVKKPSLANIARKLELGQYLKLSKGEEITGGREKDYLLANTLESILGALYTDQDYQAVKKFVLRVFEDAIEEIVQNRLDIDYKSKFQEMAQGRFKLTPLYKLINEEGPDHEKIFTMGVLIAKKKFGEGKGSTKQKAEEEAAKNAIEYLSTLNGSDKI